MSESQLKTLDHSSNPGCGSYDGQPLNNSMSDNYIYGAFDGDSRSWGYCYRSPFYVNTRNRRYKYNRDEKKLINIEKLYRKLEKKNPGNITLKNIKLLGEKYRI